MKRVAVITGGATGIGFAIAKKFVINGITSVLVGRDKTKLREACEKLGKLSGFFVCDLSRLGDIPLLVKNIIYSYGQIDILVNNAGIHLKKPIKEVSDSEYQKVIHYGRGTAG